MNHESLSFNKQSNLFDNSVKNKKSTLSSHCSINRCMVFEAACSSIYTVDKKEKVPVNSGTWHSSLFL